MVRTDSPTDDEWSANGRIIETHSRKQDINSMALHTFGIRLSPWLGAVCLMSMLFAGGCARHCDDVGCPPRPPQFPPVGHLTDPVWKAQERNAEASDFVIHQHEFIGNTGRMNQAGEEHLKQIAVRANQVPEFPIHIEPSMTTVREGDEYGYPIHKNPKLDAKRRELVVLALTSMGVADADRRVFTAPATAPGFEYFEAERAYNSGFSGGFGAFGGGNNGFGGGFGGFGGRGVGIF